MGKIIDVTAAMSGVFYRYPSPEDPPYVEVGTEVKKIYMNEEKDITHQTKGQHGMKAIKENSTVVLKHMG